MTEIVDKDNPILRKVATSVSPSEITSPRIQEIIREMKEAMHSQDDGVALAAPQIGEGLRIFVVKGVAIMKKRGAKMDRAKSIEDLTFVNPQIIKSSKKRRMMEEGCLSVRWLYGEVSRSEKISIEAYNEKGEKVSRGASGLLAQIFQHEIDHLDGVLFIDKAENLREIPPEVRPKIVFFGNSSFSQYVLEELEDMGFVPTLLVPSTKEIPTTKELRALEPDIFVVASFGKILSQEILDIPKHGALNVHPSLLPKLRGPSPIQQTITEAGEPGVTIIKMDERVDHGPIIAQARVEMTPWPDHYAIVEEKLGRVGGRLLGTVLPEWLQGKVEERAQIDSEATFTRLIEKEDGLVDMEAMPETNFRKVLAYSTWPGAYMMYKNKRGEEVRVVVKDAEIKDGHFLPTRVIPAGKKEMDWQDFLRGN